MILSFIAAVVIICIIWVVLGHIVIAIVENFKAILNLVIYISVCSGIIYGVSCL